jgi:hypothetical protein
MYFFLNVNFLFRSDFTTPAHYHQKQSEFAFSLKKEKFTPNRIDLG